MGEDAKLNKEGSTAMFPRSAEEPKNSHWTRGVYYRALAIVGVLIINLIFIGVAARFSTRHTDNGSFSSTALVYRGSCTLVNRWETALSLMINILSEVALGASNFAMQTLVAPTRDEVDQSHAQHKWLDIGSTSLRNLFAIPKTRLALWFVLIITATPFHLIYNSIVFKSIPANFYDVILGPSDLNPPDIGSLSTPNLQNCLGRYPYDYPWSAEYRWDDFVSDLESDNYKTLNNDECTEYTNKNTQAGSMRGGNKSVFIGSTVGGGPWTGQYYIKDGQISAISSAHVSVSPFIYFNVSGHDETILYTLYDFEASTCIDNVDLSKKEANSTCTKAEDLVNWFKEEWPSKKRLDQYMDVNATSRITIDTYGTSCNKYSYESSHAVTDGCIVVETDKICELMYSPYISVAISLTLLVKVVAISIAALLGRSRQMPLLTVGDAISSFMADPDSTTEGMCWASHQDFSREVWKSRQVAWVSRSSTESHRQGESRIWKRLQSPKRWMHASRTSRWLMALVTFAIIFIAGAVLLGEGVKGEEAVLVGDGISKAASSAIRRLLKNGFDSENYTLVTFGAGGNGPEWGMLSYTVLANTPQLAITLTYLWYNHILTNMLAMAEWTSYGVNRKSLRVSSPAKNSGQRPTHYLSLPLRYSLPLLAFSALLHWFISQSFFYVYAIPWADTHRVEEFVLSELGYLWLPMLLAVFLGAGMLLVLVSLSFRKYKSFMPVVGSCSAAISAACHPPQDENTENAARGLLMWGETAGLLDCEYSADQFEEGKGHCSFTSLATIPPNLEKLYA
ncbi:uncharacterized protein N7496_006465 [Penicillium cataractarum]|uniref:DUF6536 domain-containing protein n=1 Tax=Penicillium cataractarum TaxID=2100454 RepID=A0A9W9V661_9EURO|nr:uncharacterized protein N7496_006465 [Penicillium cataractarum]KAJ5370373.1 hypothetical protein N7496_006465 [Penicillium cataractarum]